MKICRLLVFFSLVGLVVVRTVFACGPRFDEAYLVRGNEENFMRLPGGSFRYELKRIPGYGAGARDVKGRYEPGSDVKKALDGTTFTDDEKKEALKSYMDARDQIDNYYFRPFEGSDIGLKPFRFREGFVFSGYLPREFVLYLEGASAYHSFKDRKAIAKWEELLSLPEKERYYRSTWAAYMAGKTYLIAGDTGKAIRYFEKTREYARQGFKDPHNMSSESYGWQARAEASEKNYVNSIAYYFEAGDRDSLNVVCRRIFFEDDATIRTIVRDELSRNVLLAWTVSRSGRKQRGRSQEEVVSIDVYLKLLNALESLEQDQKIKNADRIAWLFYNQGDFVSAKRWLDLSKEKTPLTQWIRSKLYLRKGRIDNALIELRALIPMFDKENSWEMFYGTSEDLIKLKIYTEIGLLELRKKEYQEAFRTLLKGAYWEDIAYVAEKVFTTQELEDFIINEDAEIWHREIFRGQFDLYGEDSAYVSIKEPLKYLLARRLVRDGDLEKAVRYMPGSLYGGRFDPGAKLKNLHTYILEASSIELPERDRAQKYYEAGLVMRKWGMELAGTELDPDWFVFHGAYDPGSSVKHRFAILTEEARKRYAGEWWIESLRHIKERRKRIKSGRGFFDGSADEEMRALSSLPDPARRFHYRYAASEFMWRAASLLPDNDELKAKALWLGGSYLKIRDPKAADKFYKELVNTCRDTKVGRAADELRWFPRTFSDQS